MMAAMHRLAWLAVVLACAFTVPRAATAAETDTVVLLNGNRLVGEVKGLRQGSLEFKTDTMSTVYIKWTRVAELAAPGLFEVEVSSGEKYLGTLQSGMPGQLGVAESDGRVVALPLESVVKIRPLTQRFWARLDGSISFGASYAQSSGVGQGTLNANVGSKRRKDEWSLSLSQTITINSDNSNSSRTASSFTYNYFLPRRWFLAFTAQFERNPDLGFNGRYTGGSSVGRNLIQTNRSIFAIQGGAIVNRENPVEGDVTSNIEAAAGLSYSRFSYEGPKTNAKLSCSVYPSLTVAHRVRLESNASFSREMFKDFTVGMTAYDSYDSRPPTEGVAKNDVGFSVNLGWSF